MFKCVPGDLGGQRKCLSSVTGVTHGCDVPDVGNGESNLDPIQEHQT